MQWSLPELVSVPKSTVITPKWADTGARFEMAFPLKIDGAVVEGLEIRAKALADFPERAVCFHFQYHAAKVPCVPLSRIEWNPMSAHTNPFDSAHPLSRLECKSTHIHRFSDNWLDHSQRMRTGNLPFAVPIDPNPATFAELLDFVSDALRIAGMKSIQPPPWVEGDLFDGLG